MGVLIHLLSPPPSPVTPVEYCSAVWCSAADAHLKLLYRVVSGARFSTGGVFERDIAHRRYVAVLCILYKMRCFCHTSVCLCYAPPRCRTSQYRRTFILLSVSLWHHRWCGTGGFQVQGQCFFIGLIKLLAAVLSSAVFPLFSALSLSLFSPVFP